MKLAAPWCAIAARCAEDMAGPSLAPDLDERLAGWRIIGHFTALNALLGAQAFGIGDRAWYGFLAQNNADPLNYIAVFRGTEQFIEWIEDGEFAPYPTSRGIVEHGFWSIYRSARYGGYGDAVASIGAAAAIKGGATVTVIGHSLGAALATYFARDLHECANGKFSVEAQLFASPKPGDRMYANGFHGAIGSGNYTVYNFVRDLVPHAPPGFLGYADLPNVMQIKPSNAMAPLPNGSNVIDVIKANHSVLNYAAMLGAQLSTGASL
jgi:triacylglycerol lipase